MLAQFFLNITSYQFELALSKLLQRREYRAQNVFAPLLIPSRLLLHDNTLLLIFVHGVLVAISCAARLRDVVIKRTSRSHLLNDVRLLLLPRS